MHWTDRPWIALDFETTGIDPLNDRIVSYACLVIDKDGAIVDGATSIVNAKVAIPESATAIHGITNERAEAEGCEVDRALSGIADAIAEHRTSPVVAYNAAFDWTLFLSEAERHCVEVLPPAAILDPFVIDKQIDRYRKGSRRLIDTAAHYGIHLDAEEAHGAAADAAAAHGIMRAIVRQRPDIADLTLAAMTLRQTRYAEEQRASFVDYMRRSKDPSFDKPAGWPILTGSEAA